MSDSTITSKEISPGIFLHKKQLQSPDDPDMVYIFEVEVIRLNILDFTADFSGSENVILEGKNNLISVTTIEPFQREQIAKLILKKDWKLKSKFKFTLKATPKETQLKYIHSDLLKLRNELDSSRKMLYKFPIPILPMSDVFQILVGNNLKFHDVDFEPNENSVFGTIMDPHALESVVHWRRPSDFLDVNPEQGLKEPAIFYDTIEPGDIKQGILGDCWLMCALACLAERPALIERLFITREVNPQGIYRVKLCKNGEWVMVTVDDLFPCYPMAGPMFSRAHGNELWVTILEKAYAKLHGCYYLLRGGFTNEGLIDLTGCPSQSFYFEDENVQQMVKNGSLWECLKYADEEGYVICASTPGEDRWAEEGEPMEELGGLVPGYGYAVIQVREYKQNKLLNLRNPWGSFEWKGEWSSGSPLWTKELKDELNPNLNVDDGNFWMSWKEFLSCFRCTNICKVRSWNEVRIKGKFIRVQDIDDPNIEIVLSKWYYSIDVTEKTKVVVGVHQEDVRITGVAARRPFIDIGIIILKRTSDNGVIYIDSRDLSFDRQVELEIDLEPGSYIFLPRTTGCTLRRPPDARSENIKMLEKNGTLTELVESTITDIFRKFDMLLNRELSYIEFKGFYECLGKNISEKEFKTQILERYTSSSRGLTLRGFINYFKDIILQQGEDTVWQWFELLGYDRDLYSVRSRCFILTIHSEHEVNVTVRDAIQTDLDNRSNILLIQKFGVNMEVKKGVRAFYVFHKDAHAYSYGVINDQSVPIECTLDCSSSVNMLFSTRTPIIKKRIEPGALEFMLHAEAIPSASDFTRATRCLWAPIHE